jgi:alanine racemase
LIRAGVVRIIGKPYQNTPSSKKEVLIKIRGMRHPGVGAFCTDQMMVDMGRGGTAYNGGDVLFFGEMDGHAIPCFPEQINGPYMR